MGSLQSGLIALISVSVVLGIMIFVHEWGHFIAAKLLGVRVEVFSFGFGTRLAGMKRGDTDYRVSILPLGGYVRMAGDNPVETRTGADYEFLSKPRWARFLIAIAGPAMNILLAFFIFWGIYWLAGVPLPPYLRHPSAAIPASGCRRRCRPAIHRASSRRPARRSHSFRQRREYADVGEGAGAGGALEVRRIRHARGFAPGR